MWETGENLFSWFSMLADSVVFCSVATGGNCQEKYSVFHYLKNWKGGESVLKRLIPWGDYDPPRVFSVQCLGNGNAFLFYRIFGAFCVFPLLSVTGNGGNAYFK